LYVDHLSLLVVLASFIGTESIAFSRPVRAWSLSDFPSRDFGPLFLFPSSFPPLRSCDRCYRAVPLIAPRGWGDDNYFISNSHCRLSLPSPLPHGSVLAVQFSLHSQSDLPFKALVLFKSSFLSTLFPPSLCAIQHKKTFIPYTDLLVSPFPSWYSSAQIGPGARSAVALRFCPLLLLPAAGLYPETRSVYADSLSPYVLSPSTRILSFA